MSKFKDLNRYKNVDYYNAQTQEQVDVLNHFAKYTARYVGSSASHFKYSILSNKSLRENFTIELNVDDENMVFSKRRLEFDIDLKNYSKSRVEKYFENIYENICDRFIEMNHFIKKFNKNPIFESTRTEIEVSYYNSTEPPLFESKSNGFGQILYHRNLGDLKSEETMFYVLDLYFDAVKIGNKEKVYRKIIKDVILGFNNTQKIGYFKYALKSRR